MILFRDLLRTQVLFDRQGIVGTAFHGRIVGNDHAFDVMDAANAADDPGRRDVVFVNLQRRQLTNFQERRLLVEKHADAITRQHFPTFFVTLARAFGPTDTDLLAHCREIPGERQVHFHVGRKVVGVAIDFGLDHGHCLSFYGPVALKSSRPINMRRISLVPAPIS